MGGDGTSGWSRVAGTARLRPVEVCRVDGPQAVIVVALGTTPGTKRWVVAALSDPRHPLLAEHGGVALRIEKVRYDEPRGRALYARVLRAIERADIGRLRKTCRPLERHDEFFCWAFGLVSLEDARMAVEVNDASMGLARARDRGDLSQEQYLREYARTARAIRLRHAWSAGRT